MAEVWQLEFIDSTSQKEEAIPSGVSDVLGSSVSDKPSKSKNDKEKKTFASEFTKKIEDDTFKNMILSPLNQMTGGLARPIYRGVKQFASGNMTAGAILGGVGATLGIMLIQTGINHIQNRLAKVEEEVTRLNNADNVLIRAGSVSKATYYSTSWSGLKVRTNRS